MASTQRAEGAAPDRLPLAAALDVASVVAFVAIGRRNHDESGAISGLIATAWPFVVGVGVGWLVARVWLRPTAISTGVIVWLTTIVVAMALRQATGRGTALSFIIVATSFLGALLVGWRAVAQAVERSRSAARSS